MHLAGSLPPEYINEDLAHLYCSLIGQVLEVDLMTRVGMNGSTMQVKASSTLESLFYQELTRS